MILPDRLQKSFPTLFPRKMNSARFSAHSCNSRKLNDAV